MTGVFDCHLVVACALVPALGNHEDDNRFGLRPSRDHGGGPKGEALEDPRRTGSRHAQRRQCATALRPSVPGLRGNIMQRIMRATNVGTEQPADSERGHRCSDVQGHASRITVM
jgi:hypothetical protein